MNSKAVASNGSINPCDSPTARQFLFQCLVTRPIFIFRCRAGVSESSSPKRSRSSVSAWSAEQNCADRHAFARAHRCDGTALIQIGVSHVRGLVADAALERFFVQKLAQQH